MQCTCRQCYGSVLTQLQQCFTVVWVRIMKLTYWVTLRPIITWRSFSTWWSGCSRWTSFTFFSPFTFWTLWKTHEHKNAIWKWKGQKDHNGKLIFQTRTMSLLDKYWHVSGKLEPLSSSAKFCAQFASVNCFQKEKHSSQSWYLWKKK